MSDTVIVEEKSAQATEILEGSDADAWLTFCRETVEIAEPCLPFVLGFDVVWPTMVLYTEDGSHVIIGRHDAPNARDLGVHEVHPYDESLREPFMEILDDVEPETIAVNFSEDNNTADGLTYGMYRRLTGLLEGTDYEGSLVSADPVVAELRGVKSPTERERIVTAAETSAELLASMTESWEPDWTEADTCDWLHGHMTDRGLGSAWSWDYCPTVHHGAESDLGHTLPGDLTLPEGEVLHIDFGVNEDGYAADMQRLYYHGEAEEIPDELVDAFADVRGAIEAGRELVEPGVQGYKADDAAREYLTEQGWEEYQHALGHQVGRNAHDGGTLLGPRWERYGESPMAEIREGEIYTVELGVDTEWGYLGLEEMVEVTEEGNEYIIPPQRELRTIS
ncbi:Xaa-Pro peptidase family protein [Halolamina litorea]|uniref:M24 family metallopeptidase n=1 Tax=Halolamina litorea TaxID=1515593 RepID=A0ABD6BVL5_9EURY|nr:M24 family metallopeptidase [Halolamina litorea]